MGTRSTNTLPEALQRFMSMTSSSIGDMLTLPDAQVRIPELQQLQIEIQQLIASVIHAPIDQAQQQGLTSAMGTDQMQQMLPPPGAMGQYPGGMGGLPPRPALPNGDELRRATSLM